MALTPLEIENKEFSTRLRGYDPEEVNKFLDQVIRDYESLIGQNKEVNEELEIVNKKLSNYEEMQESLNKSILVAQEAADRLKENMEREIEMMKLEAEKYAKNTREDAEEYAAQTRKKAEEYAQEVHKEADDHADTLLQEAVLKARRIEDETETLRKQSRIFRQRLQLLIESQLELLTKEDWDNLLVNKPIAYPETETIAEVEKDLKAKKEADGATSEKAQESVAGDEEPAESVANEEKDLYNRENQAEDYKEGLRPAVELPEAIQE